ncbi:MAG: hypothetical protein AB7K52_02590 [Phycisphaerales bacterium]
MRTRAAAAAIIGAGLGWGSACAQVELRGQPEALDGEIIRMAPSGVEVRVAGENGTRVVGWDRVRRVAGPRAAEAAPLAELAEQLWRGRARLERRDRRAAELLFDALYQQHPGLTGPSGAVLTEGALRTRLGRGAWATAVPAWLEWLNIRYAAGERERSRWIGGTMALAPVIDASRGLCPRLPPIVSTHDDPAGTRLLADEGAWARVERADAAVRDLAALYRAAAMFECAPAVDVPIPEISTTEDAVVMVAEIVRARVGVPEQRREARARLARRLATYALSSDDLWGDESAGSTASEAPGSTRYLEAWCRAGIGRSLLREGTPAEVRQGVVEMLHVPARLADVTPELARLVLVDSADALAKIGEAEAAATLREEARRRFAAGSALDDLFPIPEMTGEAGDAGAPALSEDDEEGAGR